MEASTSDHTSFLDIIAVDMRHLTSDQKEIHQLILENIKASLKTYVNSIAIVSEETKGYNLLAIMMVHQKLQVLLQPKRFDIHAVHKAIDALKVEQGDSSMSIEVDLLRHVYKLIEKASQKMKVVGKLVWLSTKCPSQTAEVLSSLEKLKQQQVLVDFVNINSLEICPDERQFTEVSIPLANWAVALREFPNCRLHRIGTDAASFERYFKERIEEHCLKEEIVFTLHGFGTSSWRLKARPRVASSLTIEPVAICSCHQAPLGSKADNVSPNDKKLCPILKSTLDTEDISRGMRVGTIILPYSAPLRTEDDPAATIKQISPLSSLSEDLLHGKSFVLSAVESSENLEALVNILSDEESFMLVSSRYNFEQRSPNIALTNFALIPDRNSGTLLMKALVSQEQLMPQALMPVSDDLDPQLLDKVRNELKQVPRGDLDVLGLKSSLNDIINEAIKTGAPVLAAPKPLASSQNFSTSQPAPGSVTSFATQLVVAPAKKGAVTVSPVKQARNVRAQPSPPKEPAKKKAPGAKKPQRFENVMLNFDDIPEP